MFASPTQIIEYLIIILTLVALEGLLSADNALVLAILVKHLPEAQRKKALLYGLGGAVVLRFIGILLAKEIVNLWWLCAMGAGYLLFLCAKHFWGKNSDRHAANPRPPMGFWQTVIVVELTDIVFAVDSILVAVAFSRVIWVIWIGAVLGILLLRIAAGFFIGLIERYPSLDNMAYGLVGWAGVKLAARAAEQFWVSTGRYTEHTVPHLMPPVLFWAVMACIVALGIMNARRQARLDAARSLEPSEDARSKAEDEVEAA